MPGSQTRKRILSPIQVPPLESSSEVKYRALLEHEIRDF